jgi:hypothetical protein
MTVGLATSKKVDPKTTLICSFIQASTIMQSWLYIIIDCILVIFNCSMPWIFLFHLWAEIPNYLPAIGGNPGWNEKQKVKIYPMVEGNPEPTRVLG